MLTDDERNKLRHEVALGLDAEQFLNTDLGRYLVDRATDEAIAAVEKLKTIKRSDYDDSQSFEAAIMELQHGVGLVERFQLWIEEVIENGRNTQQELIDSDHTED